MSAIPRWVTIADGERVSHLLTDDFHRTVKGQRKTWCDRQVSNDEANLIGDGEYVPRCRECLRRLTRFTDAAVEPLSEEAIETVTVRVRRPLEKKMSSSKWVPEDTAESLVVNAVKRRRSWTLLSVESTEEPADVPQEATE